MKALDDFDFTPRKREADEELKAAAWAENNGWLSRKLKWEGRRDAPDRLFAGHGHLLLVEFKKPSRRTAKGGGLSGGQSKEAQRFAECGVTVPTFYSAQECIEHLQGLMVTSS